MDSYGGNPKFNCLVDLAIIKNNDKLCDLLDSSMVNTPLKHKAEPSGLIQPHSKKEEECEEIKEEE